LGRTDDTLDGAVPTTAELRDRVAALEAEVDRVKRERDFLLASLDQVPVGMELYDKDGVARWMNRAMVEFAGLKDPDEAIGKFNILTDPFATQTGVDRWYRRAYAGALTRTEEIRLSMAVAADWETTGKEVAFRMALCPRHATDGTVDGVMAIMHEVTQHDVIRRVSDGLLACSDRRTGAQAVVTTLVGSMDIRAARVWCLSPDMRTLTLRAGATDVGGRIEFVEEVAACGEFMDQAIIPSSVLASFERAAVVVCRREDDGELGWDLSGGASPAVEVRIAQAIRGSSGVLGVIEVGVSSSYAASQGLPTLLSRIGEQYAEFAMRTVTQARLRAAFDSSPDAKFVLSNDGAVLQANARAVELFGRSPVAWEEVFRDPSEAGDILTRARRSAASAAPPPDWVEVPLLQVDGAAFPAEVGVVWLPEGHCYNVSLRDVRERRRLDAELAFARAEQIRLEGLHQTIERLVLELPVATFVLSPSGAVLLENIAARELRARLGIDADSTALRDMLPCASTCTLRSADCACDVTLRTLDGGALMVELRSTEIELQEGPCSVLSMVDLTERRLAAEADAVSRVLDAKSAALVEMEALAETIAIQRDALAVSNERYQLELDAKKMFVANMSHEIRTPLTGVVGIVGLLMREELPPIERQYVEVLHRASRTLMALVDDALDFSRMDMERIQLNPERVDLCELTSDVVESASPLAHGKGLEIAVWMDESVPRHVDLDPLRLRQVLGNLIANSVKFTEFGEVVLRVFIDAEDPLSVVFEVRDTGIGFAEADSERLFAPFAQANTSLHRKHGGAGLGLAISRTLVELMGGRITARAVPNSGSCFRVVLPVRASSESSTELTGLESLRVLVLDSHLAAREGAAHLLKRGGAAVFQTSTVGEAIRVASGLHLAGAPCTVALVAVPLGMSSLDISRLVATLEGVQIPRVILMTSGAHLSFGDAPSQLPSRCATVSKPVRARMLHEILVSPSPNANAEPSSQTTRLAPVRGRVLVVDDVAVNRWIVCKMLQQLDVEVDQAASGTSAISKLAESRYDLVLLDLQMPDVDGYEVLKRLRTLPRTGAAPRCISFSAHATQEGRAAAIAAGFDDHLAKPLTFEMLQGVLERNLVMV
jgi:signal transduction histidine kinase/CheY-like chemotaxis protein/PAS domain-containing protein